MFDKIQLTLSIHVIDKLMRTHDEMRNRNLRMAEQDCQFVIDRLCDLYLESNLDKKQEPRR